MDNLKNALNSMNISYNNDALEKFNLYMEGVLQWNDKINLTAIVDKDQFIKKHFIDSVVICQYEEFKNAKHVIDVGTGAGFPGIPLAIIANDKEFVLMDSLNKRLKVINTLTESIGIRNASTLHGRAEEVGKNKEYREKFDICVSRAVANLSTLVEYCLPLLKIGGYFICYKGPDLEKELVVAETAINKLGGKVEKVEIVNIPNFELDHRLLFIKKINTTPAKYPRKAGTPAKDPII